MDIMELDLQIDSFVETSRGGIIILAKEPRTNKIYRIQFSKGDYDWLIARRLEQQK